jgi:hypothetical protein
VHARGYEGERRGKEGEGCGGLKHTHEINGCTGCVCSIFFNYTHIINYT